MPEDKLRATELLVASDAMKSDLYESGVAPLTALGLTELEARIYMFLAEHASVTAYRVAQGIGRPVANTYKAMESLRNKGAVITDETGGGRCRAVSPAEWLEHVERDFKANRDAAAGVLERLRPAPVDSGVYSLDSCEQVLQQARRMLDGARDSVLLDVFPRFLDLLRPDMERAAARGVTLQACTYDRDSLPGLMAVADPRARLIRRRWSGHWLVLTGDGTDVLIAYLDQQEKVQQALWSRSPSLAWVVYSHLAHTLLALELRAAIERGATARRLKAIISAFDARHADLPTAARKEPE